MIKLFTHTDLDGVGCAILAKLAFGNNVDITYCDYDEINKAVADDLANYYEAVYITDISINEELAELINESGKIYRLFDHHGTALGLNRYDWCRVVVELDGIKTSGTELFFKYLEETALLSPGESVYKFVEIVRNYDTWRWTTLTDGYICKQYNDLLYIYGRDEFINNMFIWLGMYNFPELTEDQKSILAIRQREINEYINYKESQIISHNLYFDNRKYFMGIVFAEKYVSELGNKLSERHPEFDFIAMIDIGAGKVSYRTVKTNIDLGKDVAAAFGGGGHPQAAGSEFESSFVAESVFMDLFR